MAAANTRDVFGRTALFRAAQLGEGVEMITALLIAGADVDAADASGATPLHAAAASGDRDAVCALLEAGASVTATTRAGATPRVAAANDAVRSLLTAASAGSLVPVTFSWKSGGVVVYVSGSFCSWGQGALLRLTPGEGHQVSLHLPRKLFPIQYKYFVDGRWFVDDSMPTVLDTAGNLNNVVNLLGDTASHTTAVASSASSTSTPHHSREDDLVRSFVARAAASKLSTTPSKAAPSTGVSDTPPKMSGASASSGSKLPSKAAPSVSASVTISDAATSTSAAVAPAFHIADSILFAPPTAVAAPAALLASSSPPADAPRVPTSSADADIEPEKGSVARLAIALSKLYSSKDDVAKASVAETTAAKHIGNVKGLWQALVVKYGESTVKTFRDWFDGVEESAPPAPQKAASVAEMTFNATNVTDNDDVDEGDCDDDDEDDEEDEDDDSDLDEEEDEEDNVAAPAAAVKSRSLAETAELLSGGPGAWKCPTCLAPNKSSRVTCACCDTPNPASPPEVKAPPPGPNAASMFSGTIAAPLPALQPATAAGFLFGAPVPAPNAKAAPTSPTAAPGPFSPTAPVHSPAPGLFGGATEKAGSLFGAPAAAGIFAAAAPTRLVFGAPAAAPLKFGAAAPMALFGATAQAPTQGLFGQLPSPSPTGPGGAVLVAYPVGPPAFGNAAQGGSGSFGAAALGGGSIFGAAAQGGGGIFGAAAQGGGPVFGAAAQGGGPVFGAAAQAGGAVFGGGALLPNAPANGQKGGALFGAAFGMIDAANAAFPSPSQPKK